MSKTILTHSHLYFENVFKDVGNGPLTHAMKNVVHRLGLNNKGRIYFAQTFPFVDPSKQQPVVVYQNSDVCLYLSDPDDIKAVEMWKAFGNTIDLTFYDITEPHQIPSNAWKVSGTYPAVITRVHHSPYTRIHMGGIVHRGLDIKMNVLDYLKNLAAYTAP